MGKFVEQIIKTSGIMKERSNREDGWGIGWNWPDIIRNNNSMKDIIIKLVLRNNPLVSYLIIYSPLIIGLSLSIIESMTGVYLCRFPLVVYFFPFPYLLFLTVWMDTVYFAIRPTIKCETGLNDKKFIKLIAISKWTLLILSVVIWLTELIANIDIQNLNLFVKIILIVIWSIAMIFMLIAYYACYYASGFIGKLIVVAENQKPFDNTGDYNISLFSWRGALPNVYRKTHNRIENILK